MISKQGIHRILVSRLRFMGDVILTTPMLHALREAFPRAHITYLAEKPYQTLLENHPAVNYTIDYNDRVGYMRLIYKLMRSKYDLAREKMAAGTVCIPGKQAGVRTGCTGFFQYQSRG